MKRRLYKSKKERQKEADKKEFRELRNIMSKMKNKTATDAEIKKYAKLRETVTGKLGGDEQFKGQFKSFKEKLNIKETRKVNVKPPKGRPVLKTKKTSGGKTLLGEIKKRIGENRKTKNKKTYKAGRR
tara:strand:- start:2817 stop:3200 length:384 start_codon:yes stop_codon:yes gene_type:complete